MLIKKILITGNAGFIGYHLSSKLLDMGLDLMCIDNLNDYYEVSLKKSRLSLLKKKAKETRESSYLFKEVDLKNRLKLFEIIDEFKPDAICHLAAQAGVRFSLLNPQSYVDNNITATLNLLEASRNYGVKEFIFASTSSVYGLNSRVPFSEEDRTDTTISPYSASKKACENLCHTYHHLYGINFRILRFFTVYGPWGRPDMALFNFTRNILSDKPIEVYNHGKMKRDFTYVEDIVDGFISAINASLDFEIINLGRGFPVKLLDFINALEEEIGIEANKVMLDLQPGDVPETFADISKAKKYLNYNPKIDLNQGIGKFVKWYEDYFKI